LQRSPDLVRAVQVCIILGELDPVACRWPPDAAPPTISTSRFLCVGVSVGNPIGVSSKSCIDDHPFA
jgi:hypothetical protein